uniref:hypothetical protein n=1 Tax=Acetobacter cibinongensis TaxID=146475 RepID=UPI0038D1DF10
MQAILSGAGSLFTAAQADQKEYVGEVCSTAPFTAAQAAQKIRRHRHDATRWFTAAQAAQKHYTARWVTG